jgi:hypothetical protein
MREYLRDGRATLAAAGRSAKSRMPPPHCCAAMRSCCWRAPATLAYVKFPLRRAVRASQKPAACPRGPCGLFSHSALLALDLIPLSRSTGCPLASPRLACPALPSPPLPCPPLPSPALPSPRLASPRLASPRLASPRALMQEPAQAVRGRTERSLQRTRTRRECAPCRLTSGLSSICVARAGADRRAACDAAAAAAARQLSARARGRRGARHAMRHAARYRRA